MIVCPRCTAVLRKVPGLHQEGEPYLCTDEQGAFMLCLHCGTRVPWAEPPSDDFSDGDPAFA